jgi:flagellar hook-length control protein FliK
MNATPSVAASCAPASPAGASGATNAPAETSAIGDFAAMLEALSALPAAAPAVAAAADIETEAAAGEGAGASEAAGESGIAALANGWPWIGLPAAAPALPAAGTSATPPNAASSTTAASPIEGLTGRPGGPNAAATATSALPIAGAPDLAPRGKAAHAAAADALLPAAVTPPEHAARIEAPASLTDAASALAPTAAAISPTLSPTTHTPPVHEAALTSRPGEPAFAADLAAEVRVMVEGGLQEAELSLHPAELGPIQVQLRINGGSADISLAAANGFTRDGLAQALPELREMLASQGLQLGQAGVDAGRDGRGFADAPPRQQHGGQAAAGSARDNSVAAAAPRRAAVRTLLDLYA